VPWRSWIDSYEVVYSGRAFVKSITHEDRSWAYRRKPHLVLDERHKDRIRERRKTKQTEKGEGKTEGKKNRKRRIETYERK
jgi:hypothetical protein